MSPPTDATDTPREAVVLFGHGSRDPAWHAAMESVAAAVRQRAPGMPVACAYLELTTPDLPGAIARLLADHPTLGRLRVFPLFLGTGRHVREDLPALVHSARARWPALAIELLPSAGEHAEVIECLASAAIGIPADQGTRL